MSTRHIPYPPDFDVNYHEAQQAQRVQAAIYTALDDALEADVPEPLGHVVCRKWMMRTR